MINDYTAELFRKLSNKAHARLAQNALELPETIKVASACSGTDVWHSMCQATMDILSEAAMAPKKLESLFVCEKVPFK